MKSNGGKNSPSSNQQSTNALFKIRGLCLMKWFNNFQIFWNVKTPILRLVHRKLFSFFSFPASLFLALEIDEDLDRQGNFFCGIPKYGKF